MPRGNGTGPTGMGPMTGRGAGFCAGFHNPGYANPGMGYGMGCGRGFRRMGRMAGGPGRARFGYPMNPAGTYGPAVDEKEALANQANFLEKQLQQVRGRLKDLEY